VTGAHVTAALAGNSLFDLGDYLGRFHPDALLRSAEYRRAVTRIDPLAFALIYLGHHLKGQETGGRVTLSEFHLNLIEEAKRWIIPDTEPAQHRDCYVAPRGSGKSSWLHLILPLWAAAHGWRKFVATFSDSGTQSEMHLATFKRELDTNKVLRHDFPDLCAPARRPRGMVAADRAGMLVTRSGFTIAARGLDASSLGMKVNERRPDLLLIDDAEPDASNYSAYQMEKRLHTLLSTVLQLNVYARVVLVGTTTMPGSIIHSLIKTVTQPGEEHPDWIRDENFQVHYYPAILDNGDGTERSLWPEKWPLEYLQSIRHTRSYRLNYANDPLAAEGDYWTDDDFRYDVPPAITRRILSIDPATTTRTTSDFTGLAVVGYDPTAGRCSVEYTRGLKLTPAELRAHVLALLGARPEIRGVLIEVNQGGEAWAEILAPLPVQILTVHQTEPKTVRAARALDHYQAGLVAHDGHQRAFEEQAVVFPRGAHDDVVDAVCAGVDHFLKNRKRPRQQARQVSYA
jgi:phage terminase large subunit-like protein